MTSEAGLVLTQAHDLAQARLLDRGLAELTLDFMSTLKGADLDAETRLYLPLAKRTVANSRRTASQLADDFYRTLREIEAPNAAKLAAANPPPPVADEILETSLRVTGPITAKTSLAGGATMEAALEAALTSTLGAATRHIEGGPRDVMRSRVASDPAAGGWARRSGGSPCSFCAMLIGRGPVYRGEGTGSFRAHDHCHCKAVAFFGGDSGWTAQAAEFRELYDAAKRDGIPFDKAYRTRYGANTASPDRLHAHALLVDGRRTSALAAKAAADVAEKTATAAAKATGKLTAEQYAVMRPDSSWSTEKRDAILAELRSTESGKVLADTLDKFQDGGSIARLRTSIDKRLAGEPLPDMSAKRADAVIDALRHAPSEGVPEVLYRGMSIKGSQATVLGKYEVGADLDLNLTSFSSDRKVATRFQSMTKGKGTTAVMVELVGEGKVGIPIQNLARDRRLFKEKEWVSGGKYEVLEVKKSPSGGVILRVRQKGRL